MRRKLSFCLPNLDGGGAERSTVQVANGLAARGHDVDLVLLKKSGAYLGEVAPGVNLVDLQVARARYSLGALRRYFKHRRADILFPILLNVPAMLAWRMAGRPSRIALSDRVLFSSNRSAASSWGAKLSYLLAWRLYPMADRMVAVSQACAQDLIDVGVMPAEKVTYIYNPVISEDVYAKQKEPAPHRWLQKKEGAVVLGVGRLEPQKDFANLIGAFAALEDRTARLIILGEGVERGALQQQAESLGIGDRVDMPGFANNPYAYMARADAFVLCSRFEGLPGVLIQAMACGCTPVVTDSPGGSAEVLGRDLRNFLVPVGDGRALAQALQQALRNPYPAEALRVRAQVFSEASSLDAYERLIEEMLG